MTYISTLRPGLLVSLKTSVTGGIKYDKEEIVPEHDTDRGRVAKWATERTIEDPQEHEAAIKIRGRVRTLIASVCAQSAFGFLCPADKSGALDQAIAEARELAKGFNDRAAITKINVYVIAGKVAEDDVEAVRAIKSEMTELLSRMEEGVRNFDPEAIREAANKARSIGQMLSPAAQKRVSEAIDAARAAARKIVKAGETAAIEVDRQAIEKISTGRLTFLDLDETCAAAPVEDAAAPALDLEPTAAMPLPADLPPQPIMDF
jgi:ElaB/YqjD/DUF883 family membrane-anchored ribosome-binding protein